ncbi:DNA-binding transcriptional repressor DeoR [Rodentibacter genomosp. 2]|uniref:DNA-binding transcriptional repressor DeoR n=1 Tax=Rodentibacter genomosp. 2 TaxID=1908266 RepID=A0A1V3JEU5_9PAST|nr:DNA-binding transcriptional repressor DeoR [Rodentibacter genomosp. 2]OOF55265.1 DNA-binding transcriptional repressor DeoR [Rodentibacter genomosp. 2]
MDSKISSRIQKLEFLLKQMDKLHLREAAEILNVSEMTIRRDLNATASSIVLLGGYIVRDPQLQSSNQYLITEQQNKNIAEKMQVGKVAAALVEDDDVIFFDCGSTIPFVASQIPNSVKFTALCCSINTFMVLQDKPNCRLILCGGDYSRENSFLTPVQNNTEIDRICTTKAFISAAGVDIKQGVTCFKLNETQIKLKAMAKTQCSILVFDDSKVGKVRESYVGELNQFDQVICNLPLPPEFTMAS